MSQPVAVHIRDGEARAVIIVNRLVILGGVIHHMITSDAALLQAVGE